MREVRRVLVVEDDDTIRHVLTETLADEGYGVREACNRSEALDRLENSSPTSSCST
jgi:CheY-like chemotaxis protein